MAILLNSVNFFPQQDKRKGRKETESGRNYLIDANSVISNHKGIISNTETAKTQSPPKTRGEGGEGGGGKIVGFTSIILVKNIITTNRL